MTIMFTRAQAVAHYKSLFVKYPDTFGIWEEVSDKGKEEDWDSYKDTLYRDGTITDRPVSYTHLTLPTTPYV